MGARSAEQSVSHIYLLLRILGRIVGARSAEQSAGTVLNAKKAWGIIPETSE